MNGNERGGAGAVPRGSHVSPVPLAGASSLLAAGDPNAGDTGSRDGDQGEDKQEEGGAEPTDADTIDYELEYKRSINGIMKMMLFEEGAIDWINWDVLGDVEHPDEEDTLLLEWLNLPDNPGSKKGDFKYAKTKKSLNSKDKDEDGYPYYWLYYAVVETYEGYDSGQGHRYLLHSVQVELKRRWPHMEDWFRSEGRMRDDRYFKCPAYESRKLRELIDRLEWDLKKHQQLLNAVELSIKDLCDDFGDPARYYPQLRSYSLLSKAERTEIDGTAPGSKKEKFFSLLKRSGPGGYLALMDCIVTERVHTSVVTTMILAISDESLRKKIAPSFGIVIKEKKMTSHLRSAVKTIPAVTHSSINAPPALNKPKPDAHFVASQTPLLQSKASGVVSSSKMTTVSGLPVDSYVDPAVVQQLIAANDDRLEEVESVRVITDALSRQVEYFMQQQGQAAMPEEAVFRLSQLQDQLEESEIKRRITEESLRASERKLNSYKEALKCPVCFEDNSQDRVVATCGHHYCRPCLSKWLRKGSSCPKCRKKISMDTVVGPFLSLPDTAK